MNTYMKRWNELSVKFGELLRNGVKFHDAMVLTLATYQSRGKGRSVRFVKSWTPAKNISRSKYNQQNTKGKR